MKLAEVAAAVGVQLRGGNGLENVTGVATLQAAKPGQISFLTNPYYRKFLSQTKASAVVVSRQDAETYQQIPVLISDNPQLTYAQIATLFSPTVPKPQGIHPTAWVSPQAKIAETAWIGSQCTIEAGVVVESEVFVGPNCVICENAFIGSKTHLIAQVTVCRDTWIGQRVLVHPGAVIGSDGFGLAKDQGCWFKIPQLGGVRIEDDVEIGANTTIDRGALEDTLIGQGVKLDNQIQIAHNVNIGAHSALAGCVGIAGSVRIGRHCTLGGGVGVAGHLEIADNVHITGMSLVTKSITQPGLYSSGIPVEPKHIWNRIRARLRRLDSITKRLLALEKKIDTNNL